jgi:hypothetical protein
VTYSHRYYWFSLVIRSGLYFVLAIMFCLLFFPQPSQAEDDIQIANLELTRFMFSQVLETYIENGNVFVTQSPFGSNSQAYEFLLEKKFFFAFLKQWELALSTAELRKTNGLPYKNTLEVFQKIFSEPGFLKENQFYLKNLLGVQGDFQSYNKFSHHSPVQILKHWLSQTYENFQDPKPPYRPTMEPAELYTPVLGNINDAMLISFLNSEKIGNLKERSLRTLKDMEFFMANAGSDRKTCFWIISLFLNNPKSEVREQAEKTLALIDKIEIADFLVEFRNWSLAGAVGIKVFLAKIALQLEFLKKFPRLKAIVAWFQMRVGKVFDTGRLMSQKVKLSFLSLARTLSFLNRAEVMAGSLSVGAHWAFYQQFVQTPAFPEGKSPQDEETARKGFINEIHSALNELDISVETQHYLHSNFDTLMIYNPELKKYFAEREYRMLLDYDPTPREILDHPMSFTLQKPEDYRNQLKKILAENTPVHQIDFFSIFAQDDYQRNLSWTRVRDLRILSLAKKIFSVRKKMTSDLLIALQPTERQNKNIPPIITDLETSDQQAQYEIFVSKFGKMLLPYHTFYYIRDSRSFLRQMLGEGGNCVSIAMLQLAMLAPFWESEYGIQLGLMFEPNHMFLVAYNRYEYQHFRFDTLETRYFKHSDVVYDPKLLLAAILGDEETAQFLSRPENIFRNVVGAPISPADDPKVAEEKLDNLTRVIAPEEKDWPHRVKEYLRNLLDRSFKFNLEVPNSLNNDIAEFKIVRDLGPQNSSAGDPQNHLQTSSGTGKFQDWQIELNQKLKAIAQGNIKVRKEKPMAATEGSKNQSIADVPFRFNDPVGNEIPDFLTYKINLTSPTGNMSAYAIPMLQAKLGHFFWTEAFRGLFALRFNDLQQAMIKMQRGLFILATAEQQEMLLQLTTNEILRIMLISLKDYGQKMGKKHIELEKKMLEYFKQSRNSANAGLLEDSPQLIEINQELLKFFVFRSTVESLVNTINTLGRSDGISQIEQAAITDSIRFLEKIEIPQSLLEFGKNESIMHYELPHFPFHPGNLPFEDQLVKEPALSTELLKVRDRCKDCSIEYFPLFKYQSDFIKNLGYQSLIGKKVQSYNLIQGKLDDGPHKGNFFLVPESTGHYFPEVSNEYEFPEPTDLGGYFCQIPNKIDDRSFLELLSQNRPQTIRSQFLTPLLPLQELQCDTALLANQYRKTLGSTKEDWVLSLPEIKMKKCRATLKPIAGINLPRLSKELCDSLPENAKEGSICIKSTVDKTEGQQNNPNSVEICGDARSNYNFEVKQKTNAATLKGKIEIPLESFLSLYANPYVTDDFQNVPFVLKGMILHRYYNEADSDDRMYRRITLPVLQHLKAYWPYYSVYYKKELTELCEEIHGQEPKLSAEAEDFVERNQICN